MVRVEVGNEPVFDTLKAHWNSLPEEGSNKAQLILAELDTFLPIYNAITVGIKPDNDHVSDACWEIVERMHRYDIPAGTFAYLLVLLKESWSGTLSNSEQIEVVNCLKLIESYVIRKAIMKNDGSVKNVFNTLWPVVGTDSELLAHQLHDKNRPFHTDDEIRVALTTPSIIFIRSEKELVSSCMSGNVPNQET